MMSVIKKIFFYYCFFIAVFITISVAIVGIQARNSLLFVLFLPVIYYFVNTLIKQKRTPHAASKKEAVIVALFFLALLSVGFFHIVRTVSTPAKPLSFAPPKNIVKIPTPTRDAKNETKNQTVITIETGKDISYANIRQDATVSAKIIDKAVNGQRFSSLRQEDGWYNIILEDGKTGWVHKRFVRE